MIPREIGGAAFLPNLYTLFGWDMAHKYRILGVKKQNGAERILLFHLEYAERLVATKDKESLMKKEAIPITAKKRECYILTEEGGLRNQQEFHTIQILCRLQVQKK